MILIHIREDDKKMSDEKIQPGPIKGAHVRQSLLMGKWEIRTGERMDKRGWISARNIYPIPDETLEQIAWDWIVKSTADYEKGYSIDLYGSKKDGKREKFVLTVEKRGFVEVPEVIKE